ncbi:hypothetical protein PQX77_014317 [Marasmius sp. AFHP31]|nr:hypothetical protein PQX77_014317 [Marasmius sp. AFHP31]
MSTFSPNARGVSIDDGTFTLVQRDQNSCSSITPTQEEEDTEIDHFPNVERDELPLWADEDREEWGQWEPSSTRAVVVQRKAKEYTEFDDVRYLTGEQGIGGLHKPFITDIQFRIVKRDDICRVRDVCVGEYCQRPNVVKTICTGRVMGIEGEFLVMSYSGPGARRAFEEDFRKYSQKLSAQRLDRQTALRNPLHSPSSENHPVQTHSQTNQPENTAPRDYSSYGSTGSPSPFSPAENRDTPPAAQDDTGSANSFDSGSQEGDPVTTQSYTTHRNHYGDNMEGCTVGRTSRDTIYITYDIKIELGLPAVVTVSAVAISAITVSHKTTIAAPKPHSIAAPEPHSISPAPTQFSPPYFPSINSPVGVIALVLILRHYIMSLSRSSHLIFNS